MHRRRLANLKVFVAAIGAVSLAGVTLAGQAAAPQAASRGRRRAPLTATPISRVSGSTTPPRRSNGPMSWRARDPDRPGTGDI